MVRNFVLKAQLLGLEAVHQANKGLSAKIASGHKMRNCIHGYQHLRPWMLLLRAVVFLLLQQILAASLM